MTLESVNKILKSNYTSLDEIPTAKLLYACGVLRVKMFFLGRLTDIAKVSRKVMGDEENQSSEKD